MGVRVAVMVGVVLAHQPGDLAAWLADAGAFDAAGADALWVDVAPDADLDPIVLTAALAATTSRSLVVTTYSAKPNALATIRRLSGGRHRLAGEMARWETVAVPGSRAAWHATLAEASERGARGVLVPADPRLLDLLRNPEDPGDRQDLNLSVG
jgi:hypothetical protein